MSARRSNDDGPTLFELDVPPAPGEKWPRLSAQLGGPRAPDRCQRCGLRADVGLTRWREHDDSDRPGPVAVVLCPACAARLVVPHPRLYSETHPFEPFPGCMPLCLDCAHRDGVRCANPAAELNGGAGLELVYPAPHRVHLCRSPRRLSGWSLLYRGPVVDCSGHSRRGAGEGGGS